MSPLEKASTVVKNPNKAYHHWNSFLGPLTLTCNCVSTVAPSHLSKWHFYQRDTSYGVRLVSSSCFRSHSKSHTESHTHTYTHTPIWKMTFGNTLGVYSQWIPQRECKKCFHRRTKERLLQEPLFCNLWTISEFFFLLGETAAVATIQTIWPPLTPSSRTTEKSSHNQRWSNHTHVEPAMDPGQLRA